MKHLYYTFSLYVKSDTVSRRKFQYHRTDKMKELTVLSDLMPRHMLTLIRWESKPSLGYKFGISGCHHSFQATRAMSG